MDLFGAMWHGTIPYDEDGAGKLLQEVFQKGNHEISVDIGIGMKAEEKTKVTFA